MKKPRKRIKIYAYSTDRKRKVNTLLINKFIRNEKQRRDDARRSEEKFTLA